MNLSNNMKKYLIGGFSVIILGLAVSVYAQSSPSISSFWGVQDLESKYGQLVIMDIPVDPTALMNLANPAQGLDDLKLYVDTALSVFSDVKSSGKVFVTGCEDSYDGRVRFGSSIVDTSACASVNGDLLATDFTRIGNTTDRYLCANASGVVELCSENPNYTCTGSAPTNASMCSGDSAGLTSNTPVTLAGVCGIPKCEYTCNTGYHVEGGVCVIDTPYYEWRCDGNVWKPNPYTAQASCSQINYDTQLSYTINMIVCNDINPDDANCGAPSGTGDAVEGGSIWYCHLGGWEYKGYQCDKLNFPAGYQWQQTYICTSSNPSSSPCEDFESTLPLGTAFCEGTTSGVWHCED